MNFSNTSRTPEFKPNNPKTMKNFLCSLMVALATISLQSCDRSQANVQTLISNDCGKTWTLIGVGQTIPKRITVCELKTTLPNSPMTGECAFKSTFDNNVKARIDLDYEYVIVDPVLYITEAPYLAKTNVDGDDVSSNNRRFESAENSIIEQRFKDAAREMLDTVDIVEFDQSEFESDLLDKVNGLLNERGVNVNYLSFVPEPSTQTEQAIDVATAMKIYQSKGIEDVGRAVMSARAGATTINVNASEKQ